MDKIYTAPKYLDIILTIFLFQQEKKTTISEITRIAFRPQNYGDITKTAEYNMCLRFIKDLENKKIIKKVKPSKNDKFKTYYSIELIHLTKEIIQFLKDLPTYMGEKNRLFEKLDMKELKYIKNYLGSYYRALSLDLIKFKFQDNENKLALDNINLKDSIFILIDKLIPVYIKDTEEGNIIHPYINPEYIKDYNSLLKRKEKTKANFLLFLLILKSIQKDYLPYAYIYGFNKDLEEFVFLLTKTKKERIKIQKEEAKKDYEYDLKHPPTAQTKEDLKEMHDDLVNDIENSEGKTWAYDKIMKIIEDEDEIFKYYPSD